MKIRSDSFEHGQPIPPEPTLAEQKACMLGHYELVCRRFGEEKGTLLMRKFGCNYAQGKPGARFFRTASTKSRNCIACP